MLRPHRLLFWLFIALLPTALLGQSQGTSNLSREDLLKQSGVYLDGLFANYGNAKTKLCPGFNKRSRTAVVYMCFERSPIIQTALSALLKSRGIEEFDLIVSQDGGAPFKVELPLKVKGLNHVIIQHAYNLYPGQHHHFVKKFVFDVLGYEYLIVVEEDNSVHPDALKFLQSMLTASEKDKTVGLVSIQDTDNSVLFNETRYASSYLRVDVDKGHLWVFGMHRSRYAAVASRLQAYYEVIRGQDYTLIHLPPLADALSRLYKTQLGLEAKEMSQDAFFVNSLRKTGHPRRLTSMVRLFLPIGWQGLHFREDPAAFFGVWGRGMYEGPPLVLGEPGSKVRELGRAEQKAVAAEAQSRLVALFEFYLGRRCSAAYANVVTTRLLAAKLNMVEIVTKMRTGAEQQSHIKAVVAAMRAGG